MTKTIQVSSLLCSLCVLSFALLFLRSPLPVPDAAYSGHQKAVRASSVDGPGYSKYTLFPDLGSVTAMVIHAPDRSFHFRHDGKGVVSVNGRRADGDVYNTLISQIAELPVGAHAAFDTANAQLLLTLEITTGSRTHTARFYTDGASGEESIIVCGPADAPTYHRTDGWRAGALMMTCEGTRIQDECGNETLAY